ncbi:unnamed protein product [Candidula unifasciata]|uniref:Uncharacterized protein n=1 Tax=Candidula unifasciata TaxID=100452 RepID=A0A8S3ZET6_9EUPU|nr:unnamed protein product [Candidula unifasciata]
MSLFSGGKSKDADPFSKKSQFYVEFLGWMECRGVRGHKYTESVMRELRRRQKNMEAPPKLTIEVSRKELKITQNVPDKSKKGGKKVKFPTIPARDVTYVQQAIRPGEGRLDDVVACIFLGYMPRTQRYVHVHVYRFDEAKTAALFATQMAALVEENYERIQKVEADLAKRGEIDDVRMMPGDSVHSDVRTSDSAVGSASSTGSNDESSSFTNDEIDSDLQSLKDVQPFDSVADELKYRLQMKDKPLLLPPKDYDTIRRGHGNLKEVNRRRCLNLNIVGENAILQDNNGSTESGVDSLTPVSDPCETESQISVGKIHWPPGDSPDHKNRNFPSVSSQQSPETSVQMIQKYPKLNFMKNTPQESIKQEDGNLGISKSRGSFGNKSPEISPSLAETVYPPKIPSPGYYHPRKTPVSRLGSDASTLAYYHESRREGPSGHYESGSVNDIYSPPHRASLKLQKQMSLNDEFHPGHRNDFSESLQQHQRVNQKYRRSYFSRTISEDYTGVEAPFGFSSSPSELRFPGQNRNSSVYVAAPLCVERRSLPSPSSSVPSEKVNFSKRK